MPLRNKHQPSIQAAQPIAKSQTVPSKVDGSFTRTKLRVLFLATRDYYHPATTGGDMTLWENARYLASVGHSVTFVAASYPGAVKEETLDGIDVVRLGGIHTLWLRTLLGYFARWRNRFDVVVTEGFGGSRIPRMAPLYVREPIITEWHQIHRELFATQYPKVFGPPLNFLERLTAWVHRDTLVRAGTVEWQQSFPDIGFKPANVFVVPVSIREDWLVDPRAGVRTEPTVLWLGKVRRYKCPDHVIRAMSDVVQRVPNAKLVVAGRHDDRAYERNLEDLIGQLQLGTHVEFRFDVPETDKRALIESSSVLVVASAIEGFGIVVLEANARGVPVIASSRVPEGAVRNDYNGLRYGFGEIDRLAELIVRMLTDHGLHGRLARNGIAFAHSFGWKRVGSQFEDVVQSAARREQRT